MIPRLRTVAELAADPLQVAPLLLGDLLSVRCSRGTVTARIVEVEAYRGTTDPASHCYRGKTARNEVMWGGAGALYVYFVYGMHFCANVVCSVPGTAGAVLLRAGEVIEGTELAGTRRPTARAQAELGRGPARLTTALGLDRSHNGALLADPDSPVWLLAGDRIDTGLISSGPRVGVAAAADLPWRFWITGHPAVSSYRRSSRVRQP
ncbi:MAG: DNA-3-methyladenine glycosylase [Sciscionella sp.]